MHIWGTCKDCGKVIPTSETAVAWYGYPRDDGTALPQTVTLLGLTHAGGCAERYSEGEGDDCATRELKPHTAATSETTDATTGVTIIVNGSRRRVIERSVGYLDIVALLHTSEPGDYQIALDDARLYSVTFFHGPPANSEGILRPARHFVQVCEGMVFDAVVTGNA